MRSEPLAPLPCDAFAQPLVHQRCEFIGANREELGPVVEGGIPHASRRTAPAAGATFVEDDYLVTGFGELSCRQQTTDARTYDDDLHRRLVQSIGRLHRALCTVNKVEHHAIERRGMFDHESVGGTGDNDEF